MVYGVLCCEAEMFNRLGALNECILTYFQCAMGLSGCISIIVYLNQKSTS
jgi:hypothetical protein